LPSYFLRKHTVGHIQQHLKGAVPLSSIEATGFSKSTSSAVPAMLIRLSVIMFSVETETGDSARMKEIVRSHLIPVFKDVLRMWLNQRTCGGREVGETEKVYLKKRDSLVRIKRIEIDLESGFPRLFGPALASRVVSKIRKVLSSDSYQMSCYLLGDDVQLAVNV
ncbi:hypothetical protein Dsin_009215, partial [Dipteronia sinensis]